MSRFSNVVILMLALIFLAGGANLNSRLVNVRKDIQLTQADPLENAPPLVAFTTVALGGFRGLVADALWVRLSRLQDEGNYFELVQLADWITKLEPRFPSVWAFHAWNLSYNISVIFDDPEDRWRWVNHGIELLRDEGLKYNPDSAPLLYELSWIFFHKIGGTTDDANLYYKKQWANLMMDQVLWNQETDKEQFMTANAHWRTVQLQSDYKLNPDLMREVDKNFGPFDWRLPQAHAIYWAWLSRKAAKGYDAVAADRMIFQAMAEAFRQGRLMYNSSKDIFIPSPNLKLLPKVLDAYEKAMREHPDEDTIKTAHQNFLREAILIFSLYHRMADARELFNELSDRYHPDDVKDGIESFILKNFGAEFQTMSQRDVYAFVEGAFYQSLYWYALGEQQRALGYDQLARLCWRQYVSTRVRPLSEQQGALPPLQAIRQAAATRLQETMGIKPTDQFTPTPFEVNSK